MLANQLYPQLADVVLIVRNLEVELHRAAVLLDTIVKTRRVEAVERHDGFDMYDLKLIADMIGEGCPNTD